MPKCISFLKILALQLAAAPHLFSFYIQNQQTSILNDYQIMDCWYKSKCLSEFPLFSTVIEVATSPYAKSAVFVHLTALSLYEPYRIQYGMNIISSFGWIRYCRCIFHSFFAWDQC